MRHIAEQIRALVERFAALEYDLHGVRIYFSAPNPKISSTKTLTIEKSKEFEANFQWQNYGALFTDKQMNWYIYLTPLHPWGAQTDGGQEVIASDSNWKTDRNQKVDIDPGVIEEAFSKMLAGPDLFPKMIQVIYVNADASDKGKKYSSMDFKKYFDTDFYVVVSKDRKLVNPFGKPVGVKGQPKEEEKA